MNPIIKSNAITFGIIIGVFSMLVTTCIYVIDLELFISMYLGIFLIIVFLIIGIILVKKTKKELNGFITFKEAFTTYFLAAVIGATMSTVFNLILFNVVDVEAKTELNNLTAKFTLETMQKWGTPESVIEETRGELYAVDNYSPLSLLQGLITSFVLSAVMAVILGLAFKNKLAYKE